MTHSPSTDRRLGRRAFAAIALAAAAAPARAAEEAKTVIAFTATAAAAGLFNAQAEGFFAKHGLDTELLTQGNSVGVVAAVQSGAAQIGAVAAGVFSGAIEHGLDYQALGCQSLFGPGTDVLAAIARTGADITDAAGFAGKRVAVPGINGGTHIMFLEWLRENGGDRKKITFVEVNYAQQADILRGRTIDAVVTSEPYLTRIVAAGLGRVVTRLNDTKRNMPDAFFMASRDWTTANPKAAAAFQAALAEGVAFARADPAKSDQNTARFLKQDVSVVQQAGRQNFCDANVAGHIAELNAIMLDNGLTKKPMDPATVVWRP